MKNRRMKDALGSVKGNDTILPSDKIMADCLMDALGNVEDAYILEAKPRRRKPGRAKIRWLAAAAVVALALLFLQTPAGVAAVEVVREKVTKLFEEMFPPKNTTIMLEGVTEPVHYEAFGQLPEPQSTQAEEETECTQPSEHPSETQQAGTKTKPGFVMYIDTERYVMTEENGVFYVRDADPPTPYSREEILEYNSLLFEGLSEDEVEAEIERIQAEQAVLFASLPPCEMEIVHLGDIAHLEAAQTARTAMLESWETVSEIKAVVEYGGFATDNWEEFEARQKEIEEAEKNITEADRLKICAYNGYSWDSPCVNVVFIDDGQGGTFQVTMRYFIEATEGHAARFWSMLETFEVIEP